jgi:hypothetical protein
MVSHEIHIATLPIKLNRNFQKQTNKIPADNIKVRSFPLLGLSARKQYSNFSPAFSFNISICNFVFGSFMQMPNCGLIFETHEKKMLKIDEREIIIRRTYKNVNEPPKTFYFQFDFVFNLISMPIFFSLPPDNNFRLTSGMNGRKMLS